MPPREPGPRSPAGTPRPPAWIPVVTMAAAVIGLVLAGYLTVEHYTAATTLACPETGVVNCRKVTESAQSAFAGVPVVLLGLGFFVATLGLCLPVAWRSGGAWLRRIRVGMVGVGALFVCYLVYTELFTLNAICLWCTAVHVTALVEFAAVVLATAALPPPPAPTPAPQPTQAGTRRVAAPVTAPGRRGTDG